MTRKSTPQQQEQAARAYQAGRTLREIAADLGVDNTTVRRWLSAEGVTTRRRGQRGRAEALTSRIVDLRDQGWSWVDIAAEVGMSQTGIRKRYAQATDAVRPWMRHWER